MKVVNNKRDRKKVKLIFIVSLVCLFVAIVVCAVLYDSTEQTWLFWVIIAELVLFALGIVSFSFVLWSWNIKDLMTEYREKGNLISGGFGFLGIFGFLTILFFVSSKLPFATQVMELLQTVSSLVITAMPAFIGLLGVQFSVAIQERNRQKDLRLGSKPFFKVRCCKVAAIPDEDGHTCHAMKVKINITNISQSIGIPIKVISCDSDNCEVELPYIPLANKDVLEKEVEVTSEQPYGVLVNIAIIYKDIYENTYEMKIKFWQHEEFDYSNTEVIHDSLLTN